MWQGNSHENLEGRRGEVVRGKGKELAARWASLWTGGKRLASKILACLLRWLSPLLTAASGVAVESTIGHAISNML